jgi:glucokinase
MPSGSRVVVVANPRCRHSARVTTGAPTTGNAPLAIGIDIGGTKIAAGVVDRSGRLLAEREEPTPPRSGAVVVASILLEVVDELRKDHDVTAIGVGAAGIARWPDGRMLWAPNNAYRDWAIRDELERETGLPTVVDNDANVAGFAEARLGDQSYRDMLFLTIGTGVGGGLVLDGKIYRGPTGMGGELGHMIVDPLGPRCACGRPGCLEAVASGTALTRMGREAAIMDPDGLIARLGREAGAVTGHTVTAAAQQGDRIAQDLFTRLGRWLGIGIASLGTIFELEAVVIGGGVVHTGDLLLAPTRAAAREFAYAPDARGVPPILPATFGNDAGMIGAALLALEHADGKSDVMSPAGG